MDTDLMKTLLLLLACACPAGLTWAAAYSGDYAFPIKDGYVATVIGTPSAFTAQLPQKIPVKQYTLPNRVKMPEVFWYNDALHFSVALQDKPAPLVFNIAGTGADHNAAKMVLVQKALYQAGFHVINIGSPTELNFLLSASSSHTPGYAPDDARDIYRVMQQAYARVQKKNRFEVTGFHITGYSLGALHAAFIADLDRREKKFGIQKVFMINPPVNLYNSAVVLDGLLINNVPTENGLPMVGDFLDRTIQQLASTYAAEKGAKFNSDFLYSAYVEGQEDKEGAFRTDRTPEGLIGVSFRLSSSAMVFASDVMNHAGYIVPKEKVFASNEPLGSYAEKSFLVTFQEYVNDLVIPDAMTRHPGKTRDQLIRDASLNSIEDLLRSNPDVRAVTNQDEVILAEGEMAYLDGVMGDRLTIYPEGGHCGNMAFATNVDDMVRFFAAGDAK